MLSLWSNDRRSSTPIGGRLIESILGLSMPFERRSNSGDRGRLLSVGWWNIIMLSMSNASWYEWNITFAIIGKDEHFWFVCFFVLFHFDFLRQTFRTIKWFIGSFLFFVSRKKALEWIDPIQMLLLIEIRNEKKHVQTEARISKWVKERKYLCLATGCFVPNGKHKLLHAERGRYLSINRSLFWLCMGLIKVEGRKNIAQILVIHK